MDEAMIQAAAASPYTTPYGGAVTDPAEEWLALLLAACERHPRGKAGVAARLGVSRVYVTRAISTAQGGASGISSGVSAKFVRLVIDRLCEVRECPATLQAQPVSECRRIALTPPPTHNPLLMRIWGVCQGCIYKPSPAPPETQSNTTNHTTQTEGETA